MYQFLKTEGSANFTILLLNFGYLFKYWMKTCLKNLNDH